MGDEPEPTDPVEPDPEPEPLNDGGKRALDEERRARRLAQKELKSLKGELDELRGASQTETERAITQAKAEARRDALKDVNARIVRSEVRALAGGKFADPADAVHFLGDLDEYIDEGGEPDVKKIGRALDTVLKEKPYLRSSPAPAGNGDGGPRGESAAVDDFNSAFRRMARS